MNPKLEDLKPGDVIVADGGFNCLHAGEHIVHAEDDDLFVWCDEGLHFLDGQLADDGHLVGIVRKSN